MVSQMATQVAGSERPVSKNTDILTLKQGSVTHFPKYPKTHEQCC